MQNHLSSNQPSKQSKKNRQAWRVNFLIVFVAMVWLGMPAADGKTPSKDQTTAQNSPHANHTPAIFTSVPTGSSHVPLNAISPDTLKTFVQVFDLVRRNYAGGTSYASSEKGALGAGSIDDEMLFRYAMSGIMAHLDGHGEFLDEDAFAHLQAFAEGSIADVGLTLDFDNGENAWVVSAVAADSSAQKAGIAVGDFIQQIANKKLNESTSVKEVNHALSGLAGSQVDLVLSKAGRDKRTITLQRTTPINDPLTVTPIDSGMVLVKLPIFTDRTRQELNEALAYIKEPITAIIIDLRGNPGGVLTSAIAVASLFVDSQPVVQIVKPKTAPEVLSTTGIAPLAKLPVMVIQDRYSASAAEILALALQKNGNAIIAGETSYGKASVQSIIPIGDGTEAIKLTTAYYEGIGGKKINHVGVHPNVTLDFKDGQWLDKALAVMRMRKLATGIIVSLSSDY